MKITSLIISLVFSLNCLADDVCPQNVQPLKKGESANCSGFLFSPTAESEAWKAKQIADLEKSENDILNERLQLYMKESDTLAKQAAEKDNSDGIIRFAYFAAGVLVTGLVVRNLRP